MRFAVSPRLKYFRHCVYLSRIRFGRLPSRSLLMNESIARTGHNGEEGAHDKASLKLRQRMGMAINRRDGPIPPGRIPPIDLRGGVCVCVCLHGN